MEWLGFPLQKAFRLSEGNKSSHFFLRIVYRGMQPSSLTLGIQYKGLWSNWSIPRRTHNQHMLMCKIWGKREWELCTKRWHAGWPKLCRSCTFFHAITFWQWLCTKFSTTCTKITRQCTTTIGKFHEPWWFPW
jgi:hypothetical protein